MRRRAARARSLLVLAVVLAVVVPMGSAAGADRDARTSGAITVFAASSLTEAFTRIGRDFEARNPGTTVTFSFGASSTLASQIAAGAPADVFASADEGDLDPIADSVRGSATVFARNRLEIAVEPGNPRAIRSLADTAESDVLLVLCARAVPCGSLARRAYRRAGVPVPDAASAENVKAALTTVSLGEADAAVVYVTDVLSADGAVDGVRIPPQHNVVARYPIAVLRDSEHPRVARAFARYVASTLGQRVLERFGFAPGEGAP